VALVDHADQIGEAFTLHQNVLSRRSRRTLFVPLLEGGTELGVLRD
jgi:hypothetical protein